MKSLNPYCPRNQGVTPITNGGTGATTADEALATLGAAPASRLSGILTGEKTSTWTFGLMLRGWGVVTPLVIGAANLEIGQCRIYRNSGWSNLHLEGTSRMGGIFFAVFKTPENPEIEEGKCYLVDFQYTVT